MNNIPNNVTSLLPPTVINTVSGRFAVYGSQWFKVDNAFSMRDAFARWKSLQPLEENATVKPSTWRVSNSKNNGFYTVSFANKQWNCTCVGFGFRRDCKHVQQIKHKK